MQKTKKEKPAIPNSYEINLAKQSRKTLSKLLQRSKKKKEVDVSIKSGDKTTSFTLPLVAIALLTKALIEIENGNIVTIVSHDSELSTQEAADLLNVSRPFVIKILDDGLIQFRKIGSHRRIKLIDLIKYKDKMDQKSKKAREKLIKQAQDLNMGY